MIDGSAVFAISPETQFACGLILNHPTALATSWTIRYIGTSTRDADF